MLRGAVKVKQDDACKAFGTVPDAREGIRYSVLINEKQDHEQRHRDVAVRDVAEKLPDAMDHALHREVSWEIRQRGRRGHVYDDVGTRCRFLLLSIISIQGDESVSWK